MITDATIYVGGLDEKVTDGCLWELFVQAGPVVSVNMPKDRVTGSHQGLVDLTYKIRRFHYPHLVIFYFAPMYLYYLTQDSSDSDSWSSWERRMLIMPLR